jgi:Nucleotidyl transferase of unknown function (DUF2204)
MGGPTRAFHQAVLRDAVRMLGASGADHLVIGGLASRALLSMPSDEAEDIDVLIRVDDAEDLLRLFARRGFSTHRHDERWIYKAAMPDVTVDLIFRAGENIELDDEHLARSTTADLDGITLPVAAPEDLAVMKAVFDGEGGRQGRWYGALAMLRRSPIDWDYVAFRGETHAPRRVLSLLLYAADAGVDVPDRVMSRLIGAVTSPGQDMRAGADRPEAERVGTTSATTTNAMPPTSAIAPHGDRSADA